MSVISRLKNLPNPRLGEIWMLHRITSERQDPLATCNGTPCAGWTMTPRQLEELIVFHLRQNHRFVSIDDVVREICDTLSIPSILRMNNRWLCITLDDGYSDNYQEAVPIFRKYAVPFCIYVADGYLGKRFSPRTDTPLMMSVEQIAELSADPLCTIGAHTVNHPDMSLLKYEKQLDELKSSKHNLEALCAIAVNHCAVPGGANPCKCRLAAEAGFRSQVNGWGGAVRLGCNPFDIPRVIPRVIPNIIDNV